MKRSPYFAAFPALALLALFGIDFGRLFSRERPAEFVPEVSAPAPARGAPAAIPRAAAPLRAGRIIQARPYAQLKMAKPFVRAAAASPLTGPVAGSVPDAIAF
jgi:hypothetical protein